MRTMTAKRLQQARANLVLGSPFFGLLALRLRIEACPDIETAVVDGVTLRVNENWVETLLDSDLKTVIAHEVMHCAMKHHTRRGGRDPKRWNRACDHAANLELKAAGFHMPEGTPCDKSYAGLSAEAIYIRLCAEPDPIPGKGGAFGSGMGEVSDAPAQDGNGPASEADMAAQAREWDIALSQAAQASRGAGKLPGEVDRFAKGTVREAQDWRVILRRFVDAASERQSSWSRPDRRFIGSGLYLPAKIPDGLGPVVVAVDTSGSINQTALGLFSAELNAIISDARPEAVIVIYCDTDIRRVDVAEAGEPVEISAKGGGGTSFRPPFEHVADEGITPACLIYLTDLDSRRFPDDPGYPVIWAVDGPRTAAPFGDVIRIL